MRSILNVTVMSAVNSLIKIDAIDEAGIQVTKFFPQTNDCEQINIYIKEMVYSDELFGSGEKKRAKKETALVVEPTNVAPAAVVLPTIPTAPAAVVPVVVPVPVSVPAVVLPVDAPAVIPPALVPPVISNERYFPDAGNLEHRAILSRLMTEVAATPSKQLIANLDNIKAVLRGRVLVRNGAVLEETKKFFQDLVLYYSDPALAASTSL